MRIGELETELQEARAHAERAAARVKWLSEENERLRRDLPYPALMLGFVKAI